MKKRDTLGCIHIPSGTESPDRAPAIFREDILPHLSETIDITMRPEHGQRPAQRARKEVLQGETQRRARPDRQRTALRGRPAEQVRTAIAPIATDTSLPSTEKLKPERFFEKVVRLCFEAWEPPSFPGRLQ